MERENGSLLERLAGYGREGVAAFHMPGHKRSVGLAPYLASLGAGMDITEIPGFDDLHAARGILAEGMERAARLAGSGRAFFLVNGSTGGLLAGIRAATRYGDRVLVARNCHKAVYHAIELCGLSPVFLRPPEVPGFGFGASLPLPDVEAALAAHPDIRLVILTSPSFEGVLSDVAGICTAAHGRGIPVLVDEAHGAHLGLSSHFPRGAVAQGADLVIQSYHKTLPSLTQSAVLHAGGELVPQEEVARQLGIFQSSSPSYLLMASLDSCVRLLEEKGDTLLKEWQERLSDFDRRVAELRYLELPGHGAAAGQTLSGVHAWEPSKIVISTRRAALTGVELMEILRRDHQIQLEMALEDYAVAMTGMGDTPEMMERLAEALLKVDARCAPEGEARGAEGLPRIPDSAMTPAQAADRPWRLVPAGAGDGKICGESIWAYPPGIPLIIPGEVLSEELLERLERMKAAGVNLIGTRGAPPETVAVLSL